MLYTNFLWRHFEKLYITFLSSAGHSLVSFPRGNSHSSIKLYITFLSSAGHSLVSFPRGNSHSSINILLLLLIVEWTRSASLTVVRKIFC